MSELLVAGLSKTKHELESGIRDAEAELSRTEEYCRKLEDMIAVAKATLHAATQATIQSTTPRTEPTDRTSRPDPTSAPHHETVTEETVTEPDNNGASHLRKRLAEQADTSPSASQTA
jgi:hypothetical protein